MEKQKIQNKVFEVISQQTKEKTKVCSQDSLENDLGLDSLDVYEITMLLEKEYNILVADDVMAHWKTVDDIINSISNLTH